MKKNFSTGAVTCTVARWNFTSKIQLFQ